MNKHQKIEFVKNITDNLQESILKKINLMPEEWDGHEIRQFISDYYACNFVVSTAMKGSRAKDYYNELAVKPLL